MWLVTTLIAAIIFTILSFIFKNKYKLGFISLMLWGAVIMILVDRLFGYTGGAFLEIETNGLIKNSAILGIAMLLPVFLIWIIAQVSPKLKKI